MRHLLPLNLRVVATSLAAVAAILVLAAGLASAAAPTDDQSAAKQFSAAAAEELQRGILPGFSVAWIVDGKLVYSAGFGYADWKQGSPATDQTIYRAGSISKLFNAVAAVQLVEQGKLDLDAPVEAALPGFSIVVPFEDALPITIRQLLCHRSGMVREAPVGGYLDPSQPTIDETLASVAGCVLVNPPNTKTRYSNVGPTIVGKAVELHSGQAYGEYQRQYVLGPLGMKSSAWTMNEDLRPRLAKGRMRVARGDGEYYFDLAPEFELGTLPAGNLYTTAPDLARFAAFLMSDDPASQLSPPLIHPASLEMMSTPQLIDDATGFGLGFYVGQYRDHKTLQHSGAVYGFTTLLVVIPEERIGVVVLSNCDIAMAPVRRLADRSLDLLLEAARGQSPPEPPKTVEVSTEQLAQLAGQYESTSYWADLRLEGQTLVGSLSGQPIRLTPSAPLRFTADGRIMQASAFNFEQTENGNAEAFTAAGQTFRRAECSAETPVPPAWQALLGKYGPEFIPLVISARHGHLYATVENEYDYRLAPLDRVTFKLPPGMYADEQIVFQLDAAGQVIGAIMANQYLPRQPD